MMGISKNIIAQGGYYGIQISPGYSTQKWNKTNRSALLTLSGDVFLSAYGSEDETNVYYVKAGYHQRGSSINTSSFSGLFHNRLRYVFHNIVAGAGVQKMLLDRFNLPFYYLLGVRLEYTIGTNFKQFESSASLYYPNDIFVNHFNYGVDFGGGFIFDVSDNFDLYLELSISPDFSLQYEQEPLSNVINPWRPSERLNLPKRHVRNLSFELSFGLRLDQ